MSFLFIIKGAVKVNNISCNFKAKKLFLEVSYEQIC